MAKLICGNSLNNNQLGFSLVSSFVGIAAIGAMAILSLRQTGNGYLGAKHHALNNDFDAIANHISRAISCRGSYPEVDGLCTVGERRPLYRRLANGDLREIVNINGTQYGSFTVIAECDASQNIVARAARLAPGLAITDSLTNLSSLTYLPDPLTGQMKTFIDDETLLQPKGSPLCSFKQNQFQKTTLAKFWTIGVDPPLPNGVWNTLQFDQLQWRGDSYGAARLNQNAIKVPCDGMYLIRAGVTLVRNYQIDSTLFLDFSIDGNRMGVQKSRSMLNTPYNLDADGDGVYNSETFADCAAGLCQPGMSQYLSNNTVRYLQKDQVLRAVAYSTGPGTLEILFTGLHFSGEPCE